MPGSVAPLAVFVSLVPLGLALTNCSARTAAVLFFLCTTLCWFGAVAWLIPALQKFTHLNWMYCVIFLVAFCCILAIPYGIVGWIIGKKQWIDLPHGPFLISATHAVVISFFPTILPGNHAHSLYQETSLIQLLSIGGTPLLLFFVSFVNWQIVLVIRLYFKRDTAWKRSLAVGIATMLCVVSFGVIKLHLATNPEAGSSDSELKVGFVQPMLYREDTLDELYVSSAKLVLDNKDIDLLVWPEFPSEFSYIENLEDKKQIDRLISFIKKPMLFVSGYVYDHSEGKNIDSLPYFNTAHLIDKNKKLVGNYQKQLLVPFFEYLPGESALPFLRNVFPGTLNYIPGTSFEVFQLTESVKIIPLICYETVFPEVTRPFVNNGGNIIFNLTNDIWFGDYWGSSYHFALGMFRSVEHHIPWVRVTNSGISGAVTENGKIIEGSVTPQLVKTARTITVRIPTERSFYSAYGDIALYLLTFTVLLHLARSSRIFFVSKTKRSKMGLYPYLSDAAKKLIRNKGG